jgi:hypothetical protein
MSRKSLRDHPVDAAEVPNIILRYMSYKKRADHAQIDHSWLISKMHTILQCILTCSIILYKDQF